MKKALHLRIPEPCHEDWQTMTPNAKGRHCSSCAKTVMDFTATSDEHIINYFNQNNNICGRFREEQLNRPLTLKRREGNPWHSAAAAAMISLLSLQSQESQSQTTVKIEQTDSTYSTMVKGKIGSSILPNRDIKGTVIDENGLPLPGANIIIKGTDIGTQADFDGHFNLKAKIGQILVCSYVGYEAIEKEVTRLTNLEFNLDMLDTDMLGEIIVVGGLTSNYEYVPTKEELAAQKERRKLSKSNYFKFYKRKNKQKREERRLKRKARKAHENEISSNKKTEK